MSRVVRLHQDTYERLLAFRRDGESLDQALERLLDETPDIPEATTTSDLPRSATR